MGNRALQIPATFERASLLSDGGMSLGFHTQELGNDDLAVVKSYHRGFGWLLFKESEYHDEDLPKGDPPKDGKTPSQRLRSRMFVCFKSEKGTADGFERWYETQLEKIGQQYLERVEK